MKRYPNYKVSGIEWIGEIPEEWNVVLLKRVCDKITDGSHYSPPTEDNGYPYITVQNINGNNIDFKNCKFIAKDQYELLKRGGAQPEINDILLTKDGTIGKAIIIKEKKDFVILSSIGLITPNINIISSDFLRYFLISGLNIDQMFSFIRGSALTRLTIKLINELIIAYPSKNDEQKAIADFLDQKTRQIDTLIEKKQKQIELLKEQRTAVINQAVTKGLDPNVKMKDSGIEWIGEIPEEWEIVRLKYISTIVNGSTPKSSITKYWDGNIIWVTPNNFDKLKDKWINDSLKKITEAGLNSCGTTITPEYSIILSTRAPIGHIGITTINTCTNQGCKTIVPEQSKCNYNFLYYFLFIANDELQSLGQGSTFMELSSPNLKDFKISMPKINEQKAIATYLEQKTKQIDNLIKKIQSQISIFQEYRTSLISEVVTGKIDVRDYEKEKP